MIEGNRTFTPGGGGGLASIILRRSNVKNKETYFMVIAIIGCVLAPILGAEGYTGEVPAEWVPVVGGITAGIAMLIRWYRERNPEQAKRFNL